MPDTRTTITLKPKARRRYPLLRGLLLLLVLIAAAHAVVAWHYRRSLHDRVESLRASGERILPGDFARPSVHPRDNAAPDLLAAAAIVDDDSEESQSIRWVPWTVPIDPRAVPYLVRAKTWFEPALVRIERARQRPACRWEHRLESPIIDLSLPEINRVQSLALLVWTAAMVEHQEGRHDLVVLRLRQALYLADTCEPTPAAVAHLSALGIVDGTMDRVESLTPTLRIGDGGSTGEASVRDVRALIDALLDERTTEVGFRTFVETHRMNNVDMMESLVRGPGRRGEPPLFGRFIVAPVLDRNARRTLERDTRLVEALRGVKDCPTALSRLDQLGEPVPTSGLTAGMDSVPTARRGVLAHFSRLTDRRLAAATLAIRLYQLDHAGRRPQRLDELVPAYLPAVPLDAMAAGARPLGYLPSDERPALYSVGRNGADDRGDESAMPGEYGEIEAWRRLDRVFYVGGQTRESVYVEPPEGHIYVAFPYGASPWEENEVAPSTSTTSDDPLPEY